MSGSEPGRWGPRESRYGPGEPGDAEPADRAGPAGNTPAGTTSVGQDQGPASDVARLTDAVGRLQSQLDRMAEDLSNVQTRVKQAGIDAEEAITGALEDILTRLDRGVETTNNDKQERALAHVQEQLDELVARSGRDRDESGRQDEVGPALGRLQEAVSGLAAKSELDQDMVDALTRIETAISGLGDEGRYERRSVVVRLDQLLEAVQAMHAQSGPSSADSGDRERLIEKLDGLAEQVETVKHRVALRARPEPVTLDDATVSAVGEAVTAALAAALTSRTGASGGAAPQVAGSNPATANSEWHYEERDDD